MINFKMSAGKMDIDSYLAFMILLLCKDVVKMLVSRQRTAGFNSTRLFTVLYSVNNGLIQGGCICFLSGC